MNPQAIVALVCSLILVSIALAGIMIALGRILQKQDGHGKELGETRLEVKDVASTLRDTREELAELRGRVTRPGLSEAAAE